MSNGVSFCILIPVEILYGIQCGKHTQRRAVVTRAQVEQVVGIQQLTGEGEGGAEAARFKWFVVRRVALNGVYT